MDTCQGVFTEQFIFRTILVWIKKIFLVSQTSLQNLQTWKWYIALALRAMGSRDNSIDI